MAQNETTDKLSGSNKYRGDGWSALDSPPKHKTTRTVRVRVPMAIDGDGKWYVYGWHSQAEGNAESVIYDMAADSNDTLTWKWLVADVEVPQMQVVTAEVENQHDQ